MATEPFHSPDPQRFGAGLTEADVLRFQTILREQCHLDIGLPEAWARAIELLSMAELLLQPAGAMEDDQDQSAEFALPRS